MHRANYPFHVICVLTRESLEYPDELFDFFSDLGTVQLCLNIEEIEAENRSSSLAINAEETVNAYRKFIAQMVNRLRTAGGGNSISDSGQRMRIREIDDVLLALRHPTFGRQMGNSQNTPGQILSIAWDGSYATFSPELLGHSTPRLGELVLGNILRDSLPPDPQKSNYDQLLREINKGIENCRKSCSYFDFCRGGAPSNKLGETGRFDSTETLFCKITQKTLIDVVLDALDNDLPQLG